MYEQWKKRDACSVGQEKLSSGALGEEARGFSTLEAAAVLPQRRNTLRSAILRSCVRGELSQPRFGACDSWDGKTLEDKMFRCGAGRIPQRVV